MKKNRIDRKTNPFKHFYPPIKRRFWLKKKTNIIDVLRDRLLWLHWCRMEKTIIAEMDNYKFIR